MATVHIVNQYVLAAEVKVRRRLTDSERAGAVGWATRNSDDVVSNRISAIHIEDDHYWDGEVQVREAAQAQLAYTGKMLRDEAVITGQHVGWRL